MFATGHEMLDEVGLIHMNGRVYDPTLARFVSADPLIDGITSVQGYNRYAYVHNNPLTYTDPSGYSSWNKYRDSVVKPVVAVAIVIWTGGQSLVALQATNYAAAVGWAAAGGAAAGAVQSGTVKGAFFGAFSAVAFMGIGNAFQGATWATKGVVRKGVMGTGLNSYGYAAKVFAHSVTGGLLSEAQGGKFKHGFAAAGVTQAFAGGIDSIDAGNVGFSATRVVAAALVGGTASVVSGGKFANGAITAAFSRAFNEENHPTAQKVTAEEAVGRMEAFFEDNPDGTYHVPSADLDAIMRDDFSFYDRKRIQALSLDAFKAEAEFADGTFFDDPFVSKNFTVEGVSGNFSGSDINYYVIGGYFAARGWTAGGLETAVMYHNIRDIYQGKPVLHNLGQAFGRDAHLWSKKGHSFYNKNY
ncbi:RHS repeat-associated core domain-containing protein [Microbulbifer sp. NBRC 101763]|uniref:RHS repeat-associated core domain-containing protein n=1 Tax=Microbulbifer sp. NBRC 101763 TaxID=1113820 RepID=UPI003341F244